VDQDPVPGTGHSASPAAEQAPLLQQLLLASIATLAEPPEPQLLDRILAQPLAWKEVEAWLHSNRLTPLFYYVLRRVDMRSRVPPDVLEHVQKAYYFSLLRSDTLDAELKRILHILQSAEIPVVLLKGAALARSVYPTPGLRPMNDLDLLIPRSYVTQALPDPTGYSARFVQQFLGEQTFVRTPAEQSSVGDHLGQEALPVIATGQRVGLDLHWRLLTVEWYRNTARLDDDALWAAARPLDCGGIAAWQLSPEDTVIHLCLHAAIQHAYICPALSYVDIDRVVRVSDPGVDWDLLRKRTAAFRVGPPVYFGLCFAERYLGTPVPAGVLADLAPSALWACRLYAIQRITGADRQPIFARRSIGRRAKYLVQVLLVERGRDLLSMLFKVLFPGREWLIARYELKSSSQVALYRLLHPLWAVGIALAAFWQALVGLNREPR
jgi:hypothetical protein